MSGWLYLIRNRDLHKIGITKNFDKRMRQLKPDNVVAKLYTSDFVKLEKELHSRYKKFRIPQTEYFRLEDSHIKEIKQIIFKLDFTNTLLLGILIKSLLFVILVLFHIIIFISLNINNINAIIIQSFLWMEPILYGISILSVLFNSGKNLNFYNELKYRLLRLFVYILFAFFFKITSVFLQQYIYSN